MEVVVEMKEGYVMTMNYHVKIVLESNSSDLHRLFIYRK